MTSCFCSATCCTLTTRLVKSTTVGNGPNLVGKTSCTLLVENTVYSALSRSIPCSYDPNPFPIGTLSVMVGNSLVCFVIFCQSLKISRNVMDDNPNTSKRNRQSFQEEERRTRNRTIQTFHGLKNPKNLCYMNVVIQLMYGLRCVKDHISKIQNQQNQFLSLALKKLFHQLSSNKEASSAITFKKELTTLPYFQEFDNDHQHDSHQLLTKIIQILFQEFTSYHQSNVPFWFRSTLISKIECNTCHFISSNTGDHSTSIEIEIHGNNLEECLSNFFRKEAIDHWHCRKCLMKRTAYKYFLLQERPILILTLKRFNNNLQKINTNVNFPLDNLTIPNLVTNEFPPTNNTRYTLFAVMNHFGTNVSLGHYNLYMKVNDRWTLFDDELVVPMNEREINSSNAYTLVYIVESKLKDLGS